MRIPVPDFTLVATAAVKGVANISSVQVVQRRTSPFANDPFFQYFFGDQDDLSQREGREWATTLDPEESPIKPDDSIHETSSSDAAAVPEPREPSGSLETTYVAPESVESLPPISSDSLGGSFTDNVEAPGTSSPQKGTTGGHRPTVKQLASNTVLNGRYEIVRRIGGGGMGAVYLAKDRNLGDAPRAVKEMVESHLDPTQHEKAIGDFKRESLLLTSLEHPSIPTIYDYFYDDALSRFYLVMKYISGGDLASRMRAAIGGRRFSRRLETRALAKRRTPADPRAPAASPGCR